MADAMATTPVHATETALGHTSAGTAPGRTSQVPPAGRSPRGGLLARNPAWPVIVLLAGYPVWWALGLADFTWIFLAVPMVARMAAWRATRSRPVRVPPGFGIWLLFLVVAAAGIAAITITAPGTVPSPVSHRLLAYAARLATYVGVTVLLLYAGNLTERELPRRTFARLLGLLGIVTVVGGLAGMLMPHLQFSSPVLLMLPKSFQANSYIQASMHPGLSQVQNVLGTVGGRPKAPFDYTNTWGDCLTVLLPFLVIGWWDGGTRRQRLVVAVVILAALPPLLYSLNRGAWIGLGICVGYLAVRLAARGRLAMLGWLCAGIAIGAIVVLATPVKSVIVSRLEHGRSNTLRSTLSALAITDGLSSPVIGYGDTRQERGSPHSIAIGPSAKCPGCGQLEVGSTGQLWLLLVCDGVLGAALYLGFFARGIWHFRHDRSTYGLAGVLVLLLSFLYMFTYDAVGAPLGLTICAYALMWKNEMQLTRRSGQASYAFPDHRDRRADQTTGQAHQASIAGVARGGALNLGGALVSGLSGVAITVVVTRDFGKPEAGAFFVAISLFLIVAAIANLGAYNGAIYFIARLRALHAEREIPAILRAAVIPVIVSSTACAAVLVLLAAPLARLLLHGQPIGDVSPAAITGALRALAVAIPFAALADTMLGATRGYQQMRPTALVDRAGRPALQLLGVFTAALAGSSALLAPAWALPYLPASVISVYWLRRIRRHDRRQMNPPGSTTPPRSAAPPPSATSLRSTAPPRGTAPAAAPAGAGDGQRRYHGAAGFWRFTGPRSVAGVAQIVVQRLDIVLVGIMAGPLDAAIYTAATRFLVVGQLANAAIGAAAQPQLTRLFAIGDRRAAGTVYQVTTAWLILLTWPLYLVAIIFGPSVLAIFGATYVGGAAVMVILGLAMLVATACGQVDTVLITAGRSSWSLVNGLLAMSANVGLDLILIPRLGIAGAAIGWAVAICLANLVPLVQVMATVRMHPFGRGTAMACVLSMVSFAVIPLALRDVAGGGSRSAIVALGAGCAVMALGLGRLRGTLRLSVLPGLAVDRGPSSEKGTPGKWPVTW